MYIFLSSVAPHITLKTLYDFALNNFVFGERKEVRREEGREGGGGLGVVKSHFPASYVFVQMSPVLICLFVIPSSSGLRPCPHVSGYL